MSMSRRSLFLPDETWTKLQLYATQLGAKEGKPVTTAEAARRILERSLRTTVKRRPRPL